jgi:hypothetical protein
MPNPSVNMNTDSRRTVNCLVLISISLPPRLTCELFFIDTLVAVGENKMTY